MNFFYGKSDFGTPFSTCFKFGANVWNNGVASLCKEMNLQGKANGRKVVVFSKVRNLQGMENARKDKLESARKGNCKEWNLQVNVTFNVNVC